MAEPPAPPWLVPAVVVPVALAVGGFAIRYPIAYGWLILPAIGIITLVSVGAILWNSGLEMGEQLVRLKYPHDTELADLLHSKQILHIASAGKVTLLNLYLLLLWLIPLLDAPKP